MSSFGQQEHWPIVWIGPQDTVPNTCMTCGMFTDVRTRVNFFEQHTELVDAPDASGQIALGCLLHFLGPIGLILSAIAAESQKNSREKVARTKVVKQSMRVPQCRLCAGMKRVEAMESVGKGIAAFRVHPNFFQRFQTDNPQSAQNRFTGPKR